MKGMPFPGGNLIAYHLDLWTFLLLYTSDDCCSRHTAPADSHLALDKVIG